MHKEISGYEDDNSQWKCPPASIVFTKYTASSYAPESRPLKMPPQNALALPTWGTRVIFNDECIQPLLVPVFYPAIFLLQQFSQIVRRATPLSL